MELNNSVVVENVDISMEDSKTEILNEEDKKNIQVQKESNENGSYQEHENEASLQEESINELNESADHLKKYATFRQVEQRFQNVDIELLEWNPVLDVIAIALKNGELALHRLSWQKVWSLQTSKDKEKPVRITAMTWSPDGLILAYACDNGIVILCHVENSEVFHTLQVTGIPNALSWDDLLKGTSQSIPGYNDYSPMFLDSRYYIHPYSAPSVSDKDSDEETDKKVEINILSVGVDTGFIQLYAFGIFPCGNIPINIEFDQARNVMPSRKSDIISVSLSHDMQTLTIVLQFSDPESGNATYHYISCYIFLLHRHMEEMKALSLKYSHMCTVNSLMKSNIRSITEAWEDILLEIDMKILSYVDEEKIKLRPSMSDDFLELLMFGNPSDALEKFLLHDLTESGLKKFSHSVELSYSNIQKLLLKRLQNDAYALFYHLNDVRGMIMWSERFGPLGIRKEFIQECISYVGSFLLKITEIQQVIDSSMKNFKAFFRWLYSAILRLSDETIPAEIGKLTQQDLNFVSEFLQENFVLDEVNNKMVKLERVAQYLKAGKLAYPVADSSNPWVKFLEEHQNLEDKYLVFVPHREMSLVDMFSKLQKFVNLSMSGPWEAMKFTVKLLASRTLYEGHTSNAQPSISQGFCPKLKVVYSTIVNRSPPSCEFHIFKKKTGPDSEDQLVTLELSFSTIAENPNESVSTSIRYHVVDVKIYDENYLTVLLVEAEENETSDHSFLFQLRMQPIWAEFDKIDANTKKAGAVLDASPFIEKGTCKLLDTSKVSGLTVCGARDVVCVLFSSLRQIRFFLLEQPDEEDEDETDLESSDLRDESGDQSYSEFQKKRMSAVARNLRPGSLISP